LGGQDDNPVETGVGEEVMVHVFHGGQMRDVRSSSKKRGLVRSHPAGPQGYDYWDAIFISTIKIQGRGADYAASKLLPLRFLQARIVGNFQRVFLEPVRGRRPVKESEDILGSSRKVC